MDYRIVIPARGGSKRLPKKHVLTLGGIPLIVHTIRYAKEFFPNSSIFVNTDDSEISTISEKEGVQITPRVQGLGEDTTTTLEVLQSQLDWFEEMSITCDAVILLQATNPLRPRALLTEAISGFENSNRGSLATFSPLNRKFGKISDNCFVPENYSPGQRMQDITPSYFENGLLYITKAETIRNGAVISEDVFPFIVNHPYSHVDIDEKEDLIYAEYLLEHYPNL